jgi:hypothetical protein
MLNCTDLLTAEADLKNVQRVVSFTTYGPYSIILMKLIWLLGIHANYH